MNEGVSQSAKAEDLRDRQREWLRRCLAFLRTRPDHRNATMTTLASLAGLNKNTLTRFMNKDSYRGAMATLSIRKIADATGFPVTPDVYGELPGTRNSAFKEAEAEPYTAIASDPLAAAIKAAIGGRSHVHPFTLHSTALEDAGLLPGDVLLIDLNGQPRAGDIVCCQIYDLQTGSAETVFRLLEPPYLVAATRNEAFRKPRLLDDDAVAIKGIFEMGMKRRPAARL